MRRQARERRYHADAVMASLAHADDAAADANARSAHVLEGSEPILIGAGRNDLAVELRRGVEIVIVVVETGALEARGLPRVEHAERRAGLEPERTDGLHHGADPIEIAVPGERQAAPMQNRLAPAALAARASSTTAATSINLSALTPVW